MIEYSCDDDINNNKIAEYKNDLTLKLFINKEVEIMIYPNNLIEYIDNNDKIYKNYHITNKTNLIELQNKFLELKHEYINLIFDKKNYTKEMNSFCKCILKRYFYKNSSLKIPNNIHIKILYEN